jgi:Ran GTPase-activating protein (RanGAP) involved in mRNA processing and transport
LVTSSLLSLDLHANQLGSYGASALARAMAADCSLTSLDLSDNILTDHGRDMTGVVALCNALKTATLLTTVRAAAFSNFSTVWQALPLSVSQGLERFPAC